MTNSGCSRFSLPTASAKTPSRWPPVRSATMANWKWSGSLRRSRWVQGLTGSTLMRGPSALWAEARLARARIRTGATAAVLRVIRWAPRCGGVGSAGRMPGSAGRSRRQWDTSARGMVARAGPAAGGPAGGRGPVAVDLTRGRARPGWRAHTGGGTYTAAPPPVMNEPNLEALPAEFASRVERLLPSSRLDGWRRSLGAPPAAAFRVNSLKASEEEAVAELGREGIACQPARVAPRGLGGAGGAAAGPRRQRRRPRRPRLRAEPLQHGARPAARPAAGRGGPGPGGGAGRQDRAARRGSWATAGASPRWSR